MQSNQKSYANKSVYVVDGSRTPFLKASGKPGSFSASDLAVLAGRALIARLPFPSNAFDEVIIGCVMPSPDEVNIARMIALRLGFDEHIPAFTVQRNCASGMQALDTAARDIASGNAHLVLAGGTESMSRAPILLNAAMVNWLAGWLRAKGVVAKSKSLFALRPAFFAPVIALLKGLSDPIVGMSMGQTAEKIAHRFGISRQMMDSFATRSHHRLAAAEKNGYFHDEMETIYTTDGNYHDHDNGVRADSTLEKLGKLKPVFDRNFGKVTAGNSAQITDGAALLVLASADAVEKYNLPVMGRLVDSQWAGLDPTQMGLGPVHAMSPIMQRRNLKLDSIDYWEINEAFAGQVLACIEAWKDKDYCQSELGFNQAVGEIDQDKLNVDGGGVSIGHPVGASGARIVLHLLQTLKRNNKYRGIASLCIGGGQGGAILVERDKKETKAKTKAGGKSPITTDTNADDKKTENKNVTD